MDACAALNETHVKVKIIVGNQQGYLRIYVPTREGYKAGDLLLEQKFDDPILQIMAGKFIKCVLNEDMDGL